MASVYISIVCCVRFPVPVINTCAEFSTSVFVMFICCFPKYFIQFCSYASAVCAIMWYPFSFVYVAQQETEVIIANLKALAVSFTAHLVHTQRKT